MSKNYKAVKISEKTYWVGAIDWDIRNFHGYETSRGTTYNAFLVLGDTPVLIDTVKAKFYDEMMERISTIVNPSDIKHLISNHAEMDHSGSFPKLLEQFPEISVYASKMGVKALKEHFELPTEIQTVKSGETVNFANLQFTFQETRMLHWPDSMFTYLHDDKILFSQDAFGMHLAGEERFADEVAEEILDYEAAKYYANILLPYSPLIKGLIAKLPGFNFDIDMIVPDHGPIWRTKDHMAGIIEKYAKWANQEPAKKAVVFYDTMWESTAKMAAAVTDGLKDSNIEIKLLPLEKNHRSDVATEILDAAAIIVGSPTLNNNLMPPVADVMVYLKGLRPLNKIGQSFGSFGWGGESVKQVQELLKEMSVEIVGESVKVKYVPTASDLEKCKSLGQQIASAIIEKSK